MSGWIAKYWRHMSEGEMDFETPREAIQFLEWGEQDENLSADSIVSQVTGERVFEGTPRWNELKLQNYPDEQGVLF